MLPTLSAQAIPQPEDLPPSLDYPVGDGFGGGWGGAVEAIVTNLGMPGLLVLLGGILVWSYLKSSGRLRMKQDGTMASVNLALMDMLKTTSEQQAHRIMRLEELLELDKNTITYLQQENERLRDIIDQKGLIPGVELANTKAVD